MTKLDPLRGLNANQSGPREKIQNGDPRSSPNRDQRSGAAEAGGPLGSLQKGPTGTPEGMVPPMENMIHRRDTLAAFPDGVEGEHLPVGALDRSGQTAALQSPGTTSLRDSTDRTGPDSPEKIKAESQAEKGLITDQSATGKTQIDKSTDEAGKGSQKTDKGTGGAPAPEKTGQDEGGSKTGEAGKEKSGFAKVDDAAKA